MISREELLTKLQLCVDDPMWPDHVEMPKRLIRIVIEQLTRHAQGAPDTKALKVINKRLAEYEELESRNDLTDLGKHAKLAIQNLKSDIEYALTSTECGEDK